MTKVTYRRVLRSRGYGFQRVRVHNDGVTMATGADTVAGATAESSHLEAHTGSGESGL